MNDQLIVFGPFWVLILLMGVRWAYVKIRTAVSPQYRVKRQQAEADAYAKRKASREATQARRAAAELEWALGHPDTTEGNRLLNEKLDEQTKVLEAVEREIRTWSRLAEGTHSGAEDAKATLAAAEARKAEAEEFAGKIRAALGVTA